MTLSLSRSRKAFAAFATAAVVAVSLAPSSASAGDWRRHHTYGAAGFAGGLLVGALAAGAASERVVYEPRCWTERRRVVNAYGESYVRRVRVCD